tara:strand:+ start:307 stop:516 length:210 start_codon:yes stop_codon:yes gene_type:complete
MSELIDRIRGVFPDNDSLTDEQVLDMSKGTLLRASIEFDIEYKNLRKAFGKGLSTDVQRAGNLVKGAFK